MSFIGRILGRFWDRSASTKRDVVDIEETPSYLANKRLPFGAFDRHKPSDFHHEKIISIPKPLKIDSASIGSSKLNVDISQPNAGRLIPSASREEARPHISRPHNDKGPIDPTP